MVIYDLHTQEATTLRAHTNKLTVVRWSSDGTRLLSGDDQGVMGIWEVTDQGYSLLSMIYGHHFQMYDVEFSRDGTLMASANLDGTLRVWKLAQSN